MIDFNKPSLRNDHPIIEKLEGIPYEDKRFLKIMEKETCKMGNHYQIPLPLQDEKMTLPINRRAAEKRSMYLKKRFQRDPKFHEDYNKFMEGIISKGYAKESQATQKDSREWCLPHHRVYHPNKPDKIRVLFDCSAEFNGRSINKELIPDPDLANQLVGILTRFRENKVVFMADIDTTDIMHFQIFVAEEHQCLLRFLWWKNDNILDEPIVCKMRVCVHVFGGASSGACSNML